MYSDVTRYKVTCTITHWILKGKLTHTPEVRNMLKHLSAACLGFINRILINFTQEEFAGGVPETECVSTLYNEMCQSI